MMRTTLTLATMALIAALAVPAQATLVGDAQASARCVVLDPQNPFGQWIPNTFYHAVAGWSLPDVLATVTVSGSGTTSLPTSDAQTGTWLAAPLGGTVEVTGFTPSGTRVPHGTNLFASATVTGSGPLSNNLNDHEQQAAFCG